MSWNNGTVNQQQLLGTNNFQDQAPQVIIAKGQWQRAQSLGSWTLVGTTVAPGFTESSFEMPERGWAPNERS